MLNRFLGEALAATGYGETTLRVCGLSGQRIQGVGFPWSQRRSIIHVDGIHLVLQRLSRILIQVIDSC